MVKGGDNVLRHFSGSATWDCNSDYDNAIIITPYKKQSIERTKSNFAGSLFILPRAKLQLQPPKSFRTEGGMCANFYHFVLVHGDGQGAWCWYKVVALLRSKGHMVTALDMASCGRDPNQPEDIPTITDYFKPLMLFIETLPIDEQVILVGHSHGGIGVAFAMESFPQKIAVAVFISAEMPGPHFDSQAIKNEFVRRQISIMDSEIIYGHGKDKPPTAVLVGPKLMETKLFNLSPPEDLTLAMLSVRPSPLFNDSQSSMETALTEQNYGSVRRVFVICEKDKMLSQEFQMWFIENNPPEDVKVIHGSDHMVMVSKPDELCLCLLEIACKYR